jgi:colanic acid/amylovoran biosynthesis glycosyltransferase
VRIAFLLHSFPEWSETFLLRQVTGLLDRGHDVVLFCREDATSGVVHDEVDRRGLRARVRYVDRRAREGHARRSVRRALALARHPAWLAARLRPGGGLGDPALRFAAALAREGRFDVVHAHYGDVALETCGAAALVGAPLVASFYGYDCSSYPRQHGAHTLAPLFARAAAVTALGPAMAERLRSLGCPAAKVRLQPIGVDVRAFSPGEPPPRGPLRVLTVARLVEKKGVGVLLAAAARLRGELPDLVCDVVGDGPLRASLEQQAEALAIGSAVRFHGAQPHSRILELMRAAHCFVLASTRATDGDEEGTPIALMEASSAALPVVSTWHSDIPEVVRDGETGLLVPPGDADALALALGRLLRDPELRLRLGAKGRRHVAERFDVAVLAPRLEALYRDVVAAG